MSLVDLVIYNAEQIRGAASLTERLRNRLCHRPLHLIFFLLSSSSSSFGYGNDVMKIPEEGGLYLNWKRWQSVSCK